MLEKVLGEITKKQKGTGRCERSWSLSPWMDTAKKINLQWIQNKNQTKLYTVNIIQYMLYLILKDTIKRGYYKI